MKRCRTFAFSLIEVMVSMTLLSVIVVGLLVVFNHTTRALRAVNNTTDVLEGARSTVNFVARDFSAMAASGLTNGSVFNLYAYSATWPPITLTIPGGGTQSNVLHDVLFLTHDNDRWSAVGYFIDRVKPDDGIGTLYRFDAETNGPFPHPDWYNQFTRATVGATNVHRIADGVVQFEISIYDSKGRVTPSGTLTNDVTGILRVEDNLLLCQNQLLPAHVQLEIGLMEPETTRKFNAIYLNNITDNTAALAFLRQQVGKMHLFRQRIAIRNHSLPPAFN